MNVMERIERGSVVAPNGCALWCGALNHDGYGRIKDGSRIRRVHVIAHESTRGPVPDGMMVGHTCRSRNCWRREHLILVNARANSLENSESLTAKNAAKEDCPRCGRGYIRTKAGGRRCRWCDNLVRRVRAKK